MWHSLSRLTNISFYRHKKGKWSSKRQSDYNKQKGHKKQKRHKRQKECKNARDFTYFQKAVLKIIFCENLGKYFYLERHENHAQSHLYSMSHRYCANFLTQYLQLKSIFLSPDSNSMTHETWQTSIASNINPKMKDITFLKRFAKMR